MRIGISNRRYSRNDVINLDSCVSYSHDYHADPNNIFFESDIAMGDGMVSNIKNSPMQILNLY